MSLILRTFGESHGALVGGVLEGVPAGLKIDMDYLQVEVNKRKSVNRFTTPRQEEDKLEVVSGVFEGVSTGAPIGLLVHNKNIRSQDYDNLKESFRPGHADFTTFAKYGIRDHRGGGRSSARESVIKVGAGGVAKLLLKEVGIEIESGLFSVGGVEAQELNFTHAQQSPIFSLDPRLQGAQEEAILQAQKSGDSLGGVVLVRAHGRALLGLGEFADRLDARLAYSLMGLNGVKGVFIGDQNAARMQGSAYNDPLGLHGFKSNHCGGVLGGFGNGAPLEIWVHFKPTSSISHTQESLTTQGEVTQLSLKGRHDPCIAIRGSVVCASLCALVLADFVLSNTHARLEQLKKNYGY
ncbi:chorismate synthase [Helicobacter cynogastricus]|uniref:chorismate synthase n=1 Tax=Helicobacter cynogastricus TaxID=329937 RepID=UPI000CF11C50|nr:chorismate synthase [Helicobacter cynogastricus]